MQTQIKKLENLLWINISKPEISELRKTLMDNSMNESLAEEVIDPTLKAKVDTLRNAVYLTLTFPIKRDEVTTDEEVNFLIKSNLVISSQVKEINFLKDFVEKLDTVNINTKFNNQNHGGVYFVHLLRNVYKNLEDTVSNITDLKNIFDFEYAISKHKEIIKKFNENSTKIFGFEFEIYLEILEESYENLVHKISYKKKILEYNKINEEINSKNRNSQIQKTLTVVGTMTLPLIAIASFFSMTTKFPNDMTTSPYAVLYIMCMMFVVSIATLLYLHFKKII